MGKFRIYTQILQGNALFSGKNYMGGNNFTRPPVVMVATNFKSACVVSNYYNVILFFLQTGRDRCSIWCPLSQM